MSATEERPFDRYLRRRRADVTVRFTKKEADMLRFVLREEARQPRVSNPPRTSFDFQIHGALEALSNPEADVVVRFTKKEADMLRCVLGEEARQPWVSNPPRTSFDFQIHGALEALSNPEGES